MDNLIGKTLDGLYTVRELIGTGGMATKLSAAKIANASGADMIIANGDDFHVIHRLLDGRNIGTLFVGHLDENFDLVDVLEEDR